MNLLDQLKEYFLKELANSCRFEKLAGLYEPAQYILNLGGKRMRPVVLLLACEAYGGNRKTALPAALAIEWFHNFSLVHDDIMDGADTRRGKATVHKKYDLNTSILSGDVMLAKAYQFISRLENPSPAIRDIFEKTSIEVCEGQQMDMDFEKRERVEIEEYIQMISLKTSVLFAASMQIGALIGGANAKQAESLYSFGLHAGIAFQIQDDYLDAFAEADFGKLKGGDILQDKKTFLMIKAQELTSGSEAQDLQSTLKKALAIEDPVEKVTTVCELYKQLNIPSLTQQAKDSHLQTAQLALEKAELPAEYNQLFKEMALEMANRTV